MKVLDYTVEIHDERTGDATAHELISVKGKLVVENSAGRREYDIVFYNGGDTVVYLSPAFPENARFFEAVEAFIGEEGVDPGAVVEGLDYVHANAQVLLDAFLVRELEDFLVGVGLKA